MDLAFVGDFSTINMSRDAVAPRRFSLRAASTLTDVRIPELLKVIAVLGESP
jgi:hypothetical protein